MKNSLPMQLSPEVLALQKQIESSIKAAPDLWDFVSSSLNATEACLLTGLSLTESTGTRVTSGTETTEASLLEESYE